ncbi:DEKNAAC103689 [Brettanomyces naardenensis]|uniref:RNA helicase n=1 Tax=Brettanomyces naardenensis TaxID=13370 RepID=A0A448YNN1_BRENA|nr:DEKNAAC103689 [Brettanomyces naardenensis]
MYGDRDRGYHSRSGRGRGSASRRYSNYDRGRYSSYGEHRNHRDDDHRQYANIANRGQDRFHNSEYGQGRDRYQNNEYTRSRSPITDRSVSTEGRRGTNESSSRNTNTDSNIGRETTVKEQEQYNQDDKIQLRRQKLEAWKKKQQQAKLTKMTFKNKARTSMARLGKTLGKPLLKRNLIEDDEEQEEGEDARKVKRGLSKRARTVNEGDSTVDLDTYLDELSHKDSNGFRSTGTSQLLSDEEESSSDNEEAFAPAENAAPSSSLLSSLSHNKKTLPSHPLSSRPIVKDLYIESEFVSGLKDDEISSLRLRDGVVVHGSNVARPVLTWSQLGLPATIFSVVDSLGFDSPTPIQSEALPNIMKGSDFIGIAKTGSGKTLAYLLALFRHVIANSATDHKSFPGSSPTAVVLTPTRELALQVFKVCESFLSALKLRGCCCYGGQPISQQIAELKKRCDVIVCTPGRLIDLLCANSGRIISLSSVSYFVLDEADRMFDLGFEPQVMKVTSALRKDRQTVLFSATFPPKIEYLAKKVLHRPVEVSVGTRNLLSDHITQQFAVLPASDKFAHLLRALGDFKSRDLEGKILIFADTQNSCDSLASRLTERGYPTLCLHGGREQADRDSIIAEFREGKADVLVATSVASRGLDIPGLNLVVNYDSPTHMEDYVHRVGRTGRAGNKGESYTFITPTEEKGANDIVRLLELSNMDVPADLRRMANSFREKVKQGKAHYSGGFGGKGLEKLEEVREKKRREEEAMFEENEGDEKGGEKEESKEIDKVSTTDKNVDDLTSLSVEFSETPVTSGAPPFHADVSVNDLPTKIRWAVTNADNLGKIIEQTAVSITTKGRFYPEGKKPGSGDDPKLYLCVEADSMAKVREAVNMLNESLSEALKVN